MCSLVHYDSVNACAVSSHVFVCADDEGLWRLWAQFIRRRRTIAPPSQYSALCSDHFAPTSFECKLLLGAEADRKPCNLLKRGSVLTIDAVGPHRFIYPSISYCSEEPAGTNADDN